MMRRTLSTALLAAALGMGATTLMGAGAYSVWKQRELLDAADLPAHVPVEPGVVVHHVNQGSRVSHGTTSAHP